MRINPFNQIYKKCNEGTNQEKFDRLPEFPLLLDVELCNLCNFNCKMCPTGCGKITRPESFMRLDTFIRILREAAAYNTALRFVRWGEPLLHPYLTRYIDLAKGYNLLVHLNTNGFYIDSNFITTIVHSSLDSIKFSFQGTDRYEYKKWRGEDFFGELIDNIRNLYLYRHKRKLPFIQIGTTITTENEMDIKNFKDLVIDICDKVEIGKTKVLFKDGKRKDTPNCPELFTKLSVDWDGKVTACCSDWDRFMIVGDINNQTLMDIWSGSKINEYRRMLLDGKYNELKLCRNCTL